ncbi:uncharacterized protein LOC117651031 [Thrips palmi]|uniref:Uncharacterized protein LOC117651031 n=1 Tax=Thrips palmi TaxID=161013 RepID=A0A6P8ZZV9_THRPL|nr:uncharacterized protein LOC117651031 [Thrips palmi]
MRTLYERLPPATPPPSPAVMPRSRTMAFGQEPNIAEKRRASEYEFQEYDHRGTGFSLGLAEALAPAVGPGLAPSVAPALAPGLPSAHAPAMASALGPFLEPAPPVDLEGGSILANSSASCPPGDPSTRRPGPPERTCRATRVLRRAIHVQEEEDDDEMEWQLGHFPLQ